MFNKFRVLLKLITIIFVVSIFLSYSYFQNFQVSTDSKASHNTTTAINTGANTGQMIKILPQVAQAAELPQTNAGPVSIPILMYHEIGDGPNSLYVTDQNFANQMLYLYNNGYQVVSLAQARKMLFEGAPSSKTVALTFDDGYLTFYTKVWPLLKTYNFNATVFVISDFIGYYNYVTWDQVKEMADSGIEIGCHSMSHPSLPTLDAAGLNLQISGSKAILEQNGLHIESFCYPSGQYNNNTVNQVINSGFKTAVTVKYGIASSKSSPYLLPRVRVARYTGLKSFGNSIVTQ